MSAAGNYVFTGGNGKKKQIFINDYLYTWINFVFYSQDKTIRVWDAKTLESKYVIDEHDGWIRHLSVFEKQLYSCSYDSSLKVSCIWMFFFVLFIMIVLQGLGSIVVGLWIDSALSTTHWIVLCMEWFIVCWLWGELFSNQINELHHSQFARHNTIEKFVC